MSLCVFSFLLIFLYPYIYLSSILPISLSPCHSPCLFFSVFAFVFLYVSVNNYLYIILCVFPYVCQSKQLIMSLSLFLFKQFFLRHSLYVIQCVLLHLIISAAFCGLYYKYFTIVIYDRNDSGQYYKTRITIVIVDTSLSQGCQLRS